MSHQATTWALYVAPRVAQVHDGARFTLLALADHADPEGRGAWPKARTLAERLGKSQRTIERDLAALRDAGLIRRGDQQLVSHLPADTRPVVYDLAMSEPDEPSQVSDRGGPTQPSGPTPRVTGRGPTPGDGTGTTTGTPGNPLSTSVSHDRARELVPAPTGWRDRA